MSDEEDYMSDFLIEKCPDVRPGIVSRTAARRHEIERKQFLANSCTTKRQKRSEIEHEQRQDALNKPLSSDNKGFAMMTKMGYKPGSVLGKSRDPSQKAQSHDQPSTSGGLSTDQSESVRHLMSDQSESVKHLMSDQSESDQQHSASTDQWQGGGRGLKEPIRLDLKLDRKGLGQKTVEREKRARLDTARKNLHRKRVLLANDFDYRQKEKAQLRSSLNDLYKCQKICYKLDSRVNVTSPVDHYYWPKYVQQQLADCQNDESCEFYAYEENVEDQVDEEDEDQEEENLQRIQQNLLNIVQYLRSAYFYCVWCAINFTDESDLTSNCPGTMKDDHEDLDEL